MTLKDQIMQEVEALPESLLAETLNFVLFLKTRYVEPEITQEEQDTVLAAKAAYDSGDYLTLEQYETNQA